MGGAEPHEGRDGVAYLDWNDTEGKAPKDVPLPDDLACNRYKPDQDCLKTG